MMPYYETELGRLYHGESLEALKTFPDNSIETIITDPPYGLEFMGKKWDYEVPSIELWKECLRVLKPGGTALIFAGSRTQHRMACNVEDAGFILKDVVLWLYGSGFPKAHDIGKSVEKIKVGGIKNLKIIGTKKGIKVETGTQGYSYSKEYVAGKCMGGKQISGDIPVYEITNDWNGWKSHGLKPAYEPILVAMKPNEGSYAENALKWGVAGLNIDGSRIPLNGEPNPSGSAKRVYVKNQYDKNAKYGENKTTPDGGRYPANIILDEEAGRLLDEQSGELHSQDPQTRSNKIKDKAFFGSGNADNWGGFGDKGGASRFFYCAKASKSERNAGLSGSKTNKRDESRTHGQAGTDNPYNRGAQEVTNNHPTVKPLKLIEYLCNLTKTPTGGTILDLFAGSGTTGIACEKLGRKWILIEKEEEYCEIAVKRIKQELSQKKLPGF